MTTSTPEDWVGRDFYAELGVPVTATVEHITRAYRTLTAADRRRVAMNPTDREAARRLADAAEAFAVLSHDKQRPQYDAARRATRFVVVHGRNNTDRRELLQMLGLLPTNKPLKSSAAVRVAQRREQRRQARAAVGSTNTKQKNRNNKHG